MFVSRPLLLGQKWSFRAPQAKTKPAWITKFTAGGKHKHPKKWSLSEHIAKHELYTDAKLQHTDHRHTKYGFPGINNPMVKDVLNENGKGKPPCDMSALHLVCVYQALAIK